jgi:hypothetical protein
LNAILCDGRKPFGFVNLLASMCNSSVGENHERKTCSLCNGNEPFLKQRGVKRHKTAIQVFTAVKNLHGTIREEELGLNMLGLICNPANFEF